MMRSPLSQVRKNNGHIVVVVVGGAVAFPSKHSKVQIRSQLYLLTLYILSLSLKIYGVSKAFSYDL